MEAQTIVDTILGEAVGGSKSARYADMLAIAQVMENRAQLLGVPMKDTLVEFDAYGKSLPKGVSAYKSLAEKALAEVMANPTPLHAATFYATPATTGNLPKGLKAEHTTTGHQYFSDPKGRAIGTAQGYKSPRGSLEAWGLPATAPAPSSRPQVPSAPSTTSGATNSIRGSSMAATPFGGLAYRGLDTPSMMSAPTVGRGSTPGFMTNPAATPMPAADFRGIPMGIMTPMPAYAPEDFSFPGSRAAMNIGLAHGRPGYVAGVPARSVTTSTIGTPGRVAMTPAELASRYSPSSAASRLGVAKSTDPASSRVAQAHSTAMKGPAVNPAYAAALQAYAASRMAAMKGPGKQVAMAPSVAPMTRAPAVMAYAPAAKASKAAAPAYSFDPAPTGRHGLLGLMAGLFGPAGGMGGLGIGGGFGEAGGGLGGVNASEAAGYGPGGYGNTGYGLGSNYSGL